MKGNGADVKLPHCQHETAVIRAIRDGHWSEELREHADGCQACAAALQMRKVMLELATATVMTPAPDPRLIWLKAAFAERQRRSAMVSRIATGVYTLLAGVIGYAGYTVVSASGGDGVQRAINDFTSGPSMAPLLTIIISVILVYLLTAPAVRRTD